MNAKLHFRGLLLVLLLTSFTIYAQPPNDECAGAESIECGTEKGGTTVGASFDDVGFCGTSNTAPGVWYKLDGDGSTVTASLCGSGYDTKISVFSGDCGNLSCVGGNDDSCSLQSEVEFSTEAGTSYYILVHGFSSNTGSFLLNVSCTAPPEVPDNDVCDDAIPISCGDVVTGDTTLATGDDTLPFCGTSETASPGVWYVFNGTGDMIDITASTADSDFDTKLFVFSGSCGSLVCIDGNDDGGPGLTSEVSFMSDPGVDYYIYVTGFFSSFSGPRFGPYTLSITCALQGEITEDCNTVYVGYEPESCATLTAEAAYGTPPYTFEWSTGETEASIEVCPSETTIYSVTITDDAGEVINDSTTVVAVDVSCGNSMTNGKVLICHHSSDGSQNTLCIAPSAVQAHLDHGDTLGACDSLSCDTPPGCDVVITPADGAIDVGINEDISWSPSSGYDEGYTISVGTTMGGTEIADNVDVGLATSYDPGTLDYLTTYYVTVTPYNSNGPAEGCEGISFTTQQNPCELAIPIACGQSATGNTNDGSVNDLDSCGTSLDTAPGVWYVLEGTGDDVTASLCNSGFDTKIGIFSGSCDELTCVGGNDDNFSACGSGFRSEIEFSTVAGTSYYIYVTGFSENAGDYQLDITCTEPPVPPCESAEEVACDVSINGSTVGVEGVDFDSTCSMSDYGKWYKFEGDGSLYIIEATTDGYDIEMAISSGECPALTNIACVDSAFSTGTESYELQSEAGVTYYIYIAHYSSFSSSTGDYTLTISCGDPLPPAPDEVNTIDCADGPESFSYCYDSNDLFNWLFSSSDGSAVTLSFTSGNLELNTFSGGTYDDLLIYDGSDENGVLLFDSDIDEPATLAGLEFTGSSGNLYVTFDSDFSVSCQSSGFLESWNFDVSCSSEQTAANPTGIGETINWGMSPNPSNGFVDLN
ncbi:MAG: hypothetical protein HKO67_14190, partial [Flavobacteriaceae bacterium]|nr:hypothetical protein [Flavobacteriaceae bacterium]